MAAEVFVGDPDLALSEAWALAGDEDTVAERLDELVERTGADELMITSSTFDVAALAESDTRPAAVLSGVTGYVPA